MEAASELSSIVPLNSVEQTFKDLMTVLYDNAENLEDMTEGTVASLREIARRCPLDDGFGVYMARAALLKVDTLPKDYSNECERIPQSDEAKNKTSESRPSDWMVYPNPNDGTMTLLFDVAEGEAGFVEAFDLSGRSVYKANLSSDSASLTLKFDHLQSGLYLLRITVNGSIRLSEQITIIR